MTDGQEHVFLLIYQLSARYVGNVVLYIYIVFSYNITLKSTQLSVFLFNYYKYDARKIYLTSARSGVLKLTIEPCRVFNWLQKRSKKTLTQTNTPTISYTLPAKLTI